MHTLQYTLLHHELHTTAHTTTKDLRDLEFKFRARHLVSALLYMRSLGTLWVGGWLVGSWSVGIRHSTNTHSFAEPIRVT